MRKNPTRNIRAGSSGFTLLEILVVVVIIGILVTFATLSIGNRALDDRMEMESARLEQTLRLAAEEAETKGIELGFRYTNSGYGFYVTGKDGKWVPYADAGQLRPRELAEPFYLELHVEGRAVAPAQDAASTNDKAPKIEPQILLLSSGEMTASTLDLKAEHYAPYYHIDADTLGTITRTRHDDAS